MNSVTWFEIYVEDMNRAKKFYEAVFGVVLEKLEVPSDDSDFEMCAFPMDIEKYGAGGALVKMDGSGPGNGGTMIYFGCEDCAIEEARVSAAGGTVQKPKSSIGEFGAITLLKDTEGNMIGLHSSS